MQGAPEIKGWCPGALTPMESGDGLLLRAKIVGSKLSLTQLSEIAAIALGCGNGRIDLSQRAQLQIRGVSETTLAAAQARLKSIGLLAPDAATESRLNIVASPLAGSASFDANEIAARLARAIAEDQALESLPGKFLFLVDDGSAPGLRDVDADIRLEARGAQFAVVLDGARDQAVIAPPAAAIDAAVALARAFIELRAGRAFELRRMRALVDAMGAEPLLRASGLTFEPYSSTCRQSALSDLLGARGIGENFFAGFAAPFGRFLAGEFADLAEAISKEGANGVAADALARDFGADAIARTSRAHCRGGAGARVHRRRRRRASRHRRLSRRAGMFAGEGADAHWPRRHRRRRENAFPRRNRRACVGLRQGLRQAFGDAADARRQWRAVRSHP